MRQGGLLRRALQQVNLLKKYASYHDVYEKGSLSSLESGEDQKICIDSSGGLTYNLINSLLMVLFATLMKSIHWWHCICMVLLDIAPVFLVLLESEVTNYYKPPGEIYKNTSVVFLMETA